MPIMSFSAVRRRQVPGLRRAARWAVGTVVLLLRGLPAGAAALVDEPIQPIPLASAQDPARSELGRQLFNDKRLSGNGTVACATCHDMRHGGADGRARSIGLSGKATSVNAPTVLNAALNFRQFWDGRAESLEAQIDQVIRNPDEMGSSWEGVVRKVGQDPVYQKAFAASYKDGITQATIQNAIATYERTLLTPNARFDKYLRGERDAISATERLGYAKFKQFGCVACHQGATVGGNMFQKFGVIGDPLDRRGEPTGADLGRFRVTGAPWDKRVFKVPSLRNVALTAPYFHDASATTLEAAVDIMFRYQLGRPASEEDRKAIVQFLGTLTGELPSRP
jgi:cytochrome c peroxidase